MAANKSHDAFLLWNSAALVFRRYSETATCLSGLPNYHSYIYIKCLYAFYTYNRYFLNYLSVHVWRSIQFEAFLTYLMNVVHIHLQELLKTLTTKFRHCECTQWTKNTGAGLRRRRSCSQTHLHTCWFYCFVSTLRWPLYYTWQPKAERSILLSSILVRKICSSQSANERWPGEKINTGLWKHKKLRHS